MVWGWACGLRGSWWVPGHDVWFTSDGAIGWNFVTSNSPTWTSVSVVSSVPVIGRGPGCSTDVIEISLAEETHCEVN